MNPRGDGYTRTASKRDEVLGELISLRPEQKHEGKRGRGSIAKRQPSQRTYTTLN